MAMKEAVLGLVIERRGYGYDLVNRFNQRFSEAWNLNSGSIYTALDKLEGEGAIVGHDSRETEAALDAAASAVGAPLGRPRTRRPVRRQPKVIYEPTSGGRSQFLTWLTAPVPADVDQMRSDIFLKVGMTSQPQLALPLVQVLDTQIAHHANELARYLSQYHLDPGTRERIAWLDAVPWFMLEAMILRLQADLSWLRRIRVAAEAYRDNGYLPMSVVPPIG
jgi:Transcriptional regulator PadR-like family